MPIDNLGIVWRSRTTDEAMAELSAGPPLKPDYPDAHNNLGLAPRRRGRLMRPVASYQQAVQLKPTIPK